MSASRKGLKRVGMRTYACGDWLIDRERPRCFLVRGKGWPPGFFSSQFRRLIDARRHAEGTPEPAKVPFPDSSMPVFLRRYEPRART